jgi:hypothetical protein
VASTLSSPLVRRALISGVALASLLSLSACGSSSKSPIASNTTTTAQSAASTTTATAASTTTTAASTTTTSVAATTTTTAGGGGAKDNSKADAAFCKAMEAQASKVTKASSGVSNLGSLSNGKPSKALINDLKVLAQTYGSVEKVAPPAIKNDVKVVAKNFDATATAFASGNEQKIVQAAENLSSSGTENDIEAISTWASNHCA